MNANPMQWLARTRSLQRAAERINGMPDPVLLILPSTRTALHLAREISANRECSIIQGPISSAAEWEFGPLLRTPSEIARAFTGQPELLRTVISFPDQLIGDDLSFTWLPFLGTRYSFSVIEALLALRHRPPVFTLRSCVSSGGFDIAQVHYSDLVDAQTGLASLHLLMRRLLGPLEYELETPPYDWLAAHWFARKSEAHWRLSLREELKDLECLLRLHLLAPSSDTVRAATALAAVMARQTYIYGALSP